jgi:hypothetical protein
VIAENTTSAGTMTTILFRTLAESDCIFTMIHTAFSPIGHCSQIQLFLLKVIADVNRSRLLLLLLTSIGHCSQDAAFLLKVIADVNRSIASNIPNTLKVVANAYLHFLSIGRCSPMLLSSSQGYC